MTCPVCGAQAKIIEGGVISLLGAGRRVSRDDPEYATLPFGREGTEWYGFEIESDRIEWPAECGGYKVWVGEHGAILTEHLDTPVV